MSILSPLPLSDPRCTVLAAHAEVCRDILRRARLCGRENALVPHLLRPCEFAAVDQSMRRGAGLRAAAIGVLCDPAVMRQSALQLADIRGRL